MALLGVLETELVFSPFKRLYCKYALRFLILLDTRPYRRPALGKIPESRGTPFDALADGDSPGPCPLLWVFLFLLDMMRGH